MDTKVLQNNKEIADLISKSKLPVVKARNLSLPSLEAMDGFKTIRSPNNPFQPDNNPKSLKNHRQLITPEKKPVSSDILTNHLVTPRIKQNSLPIPDQMFKKTKEANPEAELEAQIIAKTKLERDKQVISNSISQMRDISYLFESVKKA